MVIRVFLFLSLLITVVVGRALASQEQECEVGTDGNCVVVDHSCVNNHEKCESWMNKGKTQQHHTMKFIT